MISYFALFGLPVAYAIDLAALEQAYETLSFQHHPDFYADQDAAVQEKATRITETINIGYKVLSTSNARAHHLLEIVTTAPQQISQTVTEYIERTAAVHIKDSNDEDAALSPHSSSSLSSKALPPDFLMEALEWQEAIDEVIAETTANAPDAKTTNRLTELAQAIQQRYDALLAERSTLLADICKDLSTLPITAESVLNPIRINLNCGRYWERMLHRIDNPQADPLD